MLQKPIPVDGIEFYKKKPLNKHRIFLPYYFLFILSYGHLSKYSVLIDQTDKSVMSDGLYRRSSGYGNWKIGGWILMNGWLSKPRSIMK